MIKGGDILFYQNRSNITKTFHGVTFKPGETKEVFGIINDISFVRVSAPKEPPKRAKKSRNISESLIEETTDSSQSIDNKEV